MMENSTIHIDLKSLERKKWKNLSREETRREQFNQQNRSNTSGNSR